MPELTREEKLKLAEKLPQQLQDLLYSEDTGAFLLYIGQKYNLPDEKVHLLSKLVGDIVLGIVPITSLTQEVNSKITPDAQVAMNLVQELNTELLAPAMAPNVKPAPTTTIPTPSADRYRESATRPEVVDLRKAPVQPEKPVSIIPLIEAEPHKIQPPQLKTETPLAGKPIISAPKPIETYRESLETQNPPLVRADGPVSAPIPTSIPPTSELKPQYIIRPPNVPPTDLPDNVLDLKKDKREF